MKRLQRMNDYRISLFKRRTTCRMKTHIAWNYFHVNAKLKQECEGVSMRCKHCVNSFSPTHMPSLAPP